jgi:hypothetical protein
MLDEIDLSHDVVVIEAILDFGNICRISTSGSLISAIIKICACLVASIDPLEK